MGIMNKNKCSTTKRIEDFSCKSIFMRCTFHYAFQSSPKYKQDILYIIRFFSGTFPSILHHNFYTFCLDSPQSQCSDQNWTFPTHQPILNLFIRVLYRLGIYFSAFHWSNPQNTWYQRNFESRISKNKELIVFQHF